MAHKTERHAAILELIAAHDVASQEGLRQLLKERGISVTQATLSRDLRELGIVRVQGDAGPRYARPETVAGEAIPSLEVLLPQLFSRIDGVGELIVLHTLASGAQPVSEAIDAAAWKEVLDGAFDLHGDLPINPDGGLKSFGHPVGASGLRMHYEAWLQLRGEAGDERQIDNSRGKALIHNLGGYPGEMVSFVSIVGNEPG